ncbi:MAP kinase-activated protein kinase 2 (Fragment) [Seminavis robusta]|uniref:MAP kinase-activated protein kinase 2 n=1 Tax=Seminavis robusta TaxID=568900 RepID=A0A9N8EXS2_9STRA
MFGALVYTHKQNIVHKDLKLENLLLSKKDSHTDIKLIDFGFAKKAPPGGLKTFIGTPGYVAPCILEGTGYGTQADNWSMGVIVYCMLGGYPPFRDPNRDKLFRKIRKGSYVYDERKWKHISQDAKDFIKRLLNTKPKERYTAEQALEDPWMQGSIPSLEESDDGMSVSSGVISDNSGDVSLPARELVLKDAHYDA